MSTALQLLLARKEALEAELEKAERTVSAFPPCSLSTSHVACTEPCSMQKLALLQVYQMETEYLQAEYSQCGTVLKAREAAVWSMHACMRAPSPQGSRLQRGRRASRGSCPPRMRCASARVPSSPRTAPSACHPAALLRWVLFLACNSSRIMPRIRMQQQPDHAAHSHASSRIKPRVQPVCPGGA
jgi:hypothetical protein